MKQNTLEKITAYLCPRIVSVEQNNVSFGGNQSWFTRNTAYKGGCGPVSAANILTVYADKNPNLQSKFNISIDEKHFVTQDKYLLMLQDIYDNMHIRELPLINQLYDSVSRTNKLFKYIPATIGTDLCHFTRGVLRYASKKDVYLQYRSRSTFFCGYTRGLTFIKLALSNGYPVALLTTNSSFPFMVYERPYIQIGTPKTMKRHFVTITDIRESTTGQGPELIITTWGKTGSIAYKDLYRSWCSIRSFGSGLVYFIPAKKKQVTKRAMLKAYTILLRR